MRTIYLFLTIFVCLSIILFVATFFYIDTHRHSIFSYNIYHGGRLTATAKIDKYNTEDSIIYRSITNTPFDSLYTTDKEKLSIDKRGLKVQNYNKKHLSEGIGLDVYIKGIDSSVNFLAVGHSDFAYAERLPVDKHFIIFEKNAIVSYFNLLDKYDFKEEGLQSISAVTHTYTFLPPYKSTIDVELRGEDTVPLEGKNTKTLHFVARLPDKNDILIWATRWSHVPLVIKIPRDDLEIIYSEALNTITAKRYLPENISYLNKEVTFKNKDLNLSGTLSLPSGEGPFPAVILIGGPGPLDRENFGLFTDIADGFAKRGIASLRFDKRGVGKSEGDFSKITERELIDDGASAGSFLAMEKEIDKNKIAVLGHSEGGFLAASLAAINPDISACIIMAGIEAINLPDTDLETLWSFDKSAMDWNNDYLNDIAKCGRDTSKILDSGADWSFLLQKRVFLKKRRLGMERKPMEVIRKIKVPVLILRGRKDTVIPAEGIKLLEETLKEAGNARSQVVFFNKLNYFFGKKVDDGIHRSHISVDTEVTDSIITWLNENMISPPAAEPQPPAAEPQPVAQEAEPQVPPRPQPEPAQSGQEGAL